MSLVLIVQKLPAGVDFFVRGVNDDVFVILLSAGMDAVRCK